MCENENKQDNLVEESQEDIILEETKPAKETEIRMLQR